MRPEEPRPERSGRPDDAYKIFGRQLQQLRTACGVSPAAAARHIGGSNAKISRLEGGRTAAKDEDLDKLLNLYGVTDTAKRRALHRFAYRLNDWKSWDARSGWLCSYLVLEAVAQDIRTYENAFIPGLLQTRTYATAIVRRHRNDDEVHRRVELRMRRQHAVLEQHTTRLWAIIDRAALDADLLHGCVTRPEQVMREQIEFLIRSACLRNVTLQVLPRGDSFRAGFTTPFSLLRLDPSVADVAYLEQMDHAFFLDDPDRADSYRQAMTLLGYHAGEPSTTLETLQKALTELPV
ncbi:transcriptional regulator [Paractinoplanes durhamensis]|uniref:Transcriptional regulator n=2 Tax=Paractinoplanes durhamensis TaxID=113563 RepID=A0ABQ3Z0T7_9ACTN|nr:helix-turn-helix transcriptional regulator [Actinoplanes durhamensis]GIE03437.1 transcriptional regulator [Actinoplanes durhamensis]